jgi:hypothetical protein
MKTKGDERTWKLAKDGMDGKEGSYLASYRLGEPGKSRDAFDHGTTKLATAIYPDQAARCEPLAPPCFFLLSCLPGLSFQQDKKNSEKSARRYMHVQAYAR